MSRTITVTIDDKNDDVFRMAEEFGLTPDDIVNKALEMAEIFCNLIAESIIEAMISPDPTVTRMN